MRAEKAKGDGKRFSLWIRNSFFLGHGLLTFPLLFRILFLFFPSPRHECVSHFAFPPLFVWDCHVPILPFSIVMLLSMFASCVYTFFPCQTEKCKERSLLKMTEQLKNVDIYGFKKTINLLSLPFFIKSQLPPSSLSPCRLAPTMREMMDEPAVCYFSRMKSKT